MIGLIIKLIVCPLVVLLSMAIFPNVNYTSIWHPIIVGLILALGAHMMEVFMLKKGTYWISTVMDFVAATLIVYFVSMFFAGAEVTFFGALLTGFALTLTELPQHSYLIKSKKTQKSPA